RVKDVDSLYDFIGYVVLCAPDRFPIRDYLSADEQMNLEKAFNELRHGLSFIDIEVADEAKRKRLDTLLDQALVAYREGDERGGAHLMQDFQDLIYKRDS
ncbi:MAG TPA: hypothetical protein VN028_06755, partial [Rhodocyclaceae bacterium]|nr:hypothetical protein [Rhodocyclaceae bacterium]